MGHEFHHMVKEDYIITSRPIKMQNPQANSIIECVHQVMSNMVCMYELEENTYVDEDNPWAGILAATAIAI